MIAAPVPIIVYVAPSGARAASAGTFLVYASHLAAMAPGTNIGAATPVQLGGIPGLPDQKDGKKSSEPPASDRKALNDVIALLRSLAQLRGRDLDFAEKAVREAATLTADESELQAAERLAQAGQILAQRPEAMQLRYLTGLQNIAGERSSTIVFPVPMDLASILRGGGRSGA